MVSSPQTSPGLVGRTLGHYRVLSELGSGGMGAVYLAEDTKLGRRVALKLLPPETAARTERIERFEREARAIASLNHPGIVTLHSIEEADGIRFITMEHVEGDTLGKAIPQRGLPIRQLLPLAISLTDALSAAHRQGVLHRDLKPDNVMLTPEGRLKVLDFGLAKLMGVDADSGDQTTRDTQSVTQDGRIVGTVAYMSPEQAQGQPVDHRSDIFSLGVLLYEMASGERPFRGPTNLSVLSSVLKDEPRSLTELQTEIPRPLARMVERALEKRPEDRYQSASDMKRDLEDLKRDLDSGELQLRTTASRRRLEAPGRARGWLWATLMVAILAVSAVTVVLTRGRAPRLPPDGRQALAIFFFDNLSGDPKLDWLRTGLTDMIVTDLSRSPNLRVLSTARLYQILDELGRRDEPATSAGVVQSVARRTDVTLALVGSFVRAGPQLRIQAQLQDPASGEVIASERVEGDAETGLFALVDELTGRMRARLSVPVEAMAGKRELKEVTTASVDAYKLYSEGMQRHTRLAEKEALPYFEKAVVADPTFAMALAKLSVIHANLGDNAKGREYAERALKHAERLPPQERYYIEGRYYSLDPTTLEQAIKAYQAAVDHAPDELAPRNNLAQLLISLRRYPEAIVHLEELRRRGQTFPGTYGSLAEAYLGEGRAEQAQSVLEDYVAKHPEQPAGQSYLAGVLLARGRYEGALAAYERAHRLDPESQDVVTGRFMLAVLQQRWADADEQARALQQTADGKRQWIGGAARLSLLMYRGELKQARRFADQELGQLEAPDQRARLRLFRASIEEQAGNPKAALAQIREILKHDADPEVLLGAQAHESVCLEQLGRRDEALASRAELQKLLARLPATLGESMALQVDGTRALLRGEHATARKILAKAASTLPAASASPDQQSVEILYRLGRAALEDGEIAQAEKALRRVAEGRSHVFSPTQYVRSLALLGQIEEKQGRLAEARSLYERYLDHWGEGQMDRDEVARVRKRLAALPPAEKGRQASRS